MKVIITLTITLILALSPLQKSFAATDSTSTDVERITNNIFEAINDIDIVSLNIHLAEGTDVDTVDEDGNTPLMLASKIGNPRMVKIILAHNPDMNKQNNKGYTALMIAAEQGQSHIAGQLVKMGADRNLVNNAGLTSGEIALRNGHADINHLIRTSRVVTTTR